MHPAEIIFCLIVIAILVWAAIHVVRRGYWTEPDTRQYDSSAEWAEIQTPPMRLTKYEGSFER